MNEEEILGQPEIKQELDQLFELVQAIRTELSKAVIGQEDVVEQMLASLLVGGHILLEGFRELPKRLLPECCRNAWIFGFPAFSSLRI